MLLPPAAGAAAATTLNDIHCICSIIINIISFGDSDVSDSGTVTISCAAGCCSQGTAVV
jgi:hypothetical protein